jgi:hypothetical protein
MLFPLFDRKVNRGVKSGSRGAAGRKPELSSRRPRLEWLEDRLAPATFMVTSPADSGQNTLRQAILNVNTSADAANAIQFNFTATQPVLIPVLSALPTFTSQVTITVTAGTAPVQIDGTGLTGSVNGLAFGGTPGGSSSSGSVVNGTFVNAATHDIGLFITGFSGDAILLTSNNNQVQNVALGLAANQQPTPNRDGVEITGQHNTIGLNAANKGNVISGNSRFGIFMDGLPSQNNLVQNNFIGTNFAGSASRANSQDGVAIFGGATNNTVGAIGGPNNQNVISGNGRFGVGISDSGTVNNQVTGNLMGLDATGVTQVPNAFDGVAVYNGASANTVGGTVAGSGNTISGNSRFGVSLFGTGVFLNLVANNTIGLNTQATPLATQNGADGIAIYNGAANNTIGGAAGGAATPNVVSGNGRFGIFISGATSSNNRILGNFVGTDLSGTKTFGNTFDGVAIQDGTGNTVGGSSATPGNANIVSANNRFGVYLFGNATGNVVLGNKVGTDMGGGAALPNLFDGVALLAGASNNQIGLSGAGQGNQISGNSRFGVYMTSNGGATVTGNILQNNLIGTNAAGAAALGNVFDGVFLGGGANNNVVGQGNVISGNQRIGVLITAAANGNSVTGCKIGVGVDGTTALGNVYDGVQLNSGAKNNTIGGTSANASNIIVNSQKGDGVFIRNSGTNGNVIQNNFIGVLADKTAAPNFSDAVGIVDSAANNTIGGTVTGTGNTISGKDTTGNGVRVGGDLNRNPLGGANNLAGNGNSILGNSIFSATAPTAMTLLGIRLGTASTNVPTPNNTNQGMGLNPNDQQNYPVLNSAIAATGVVTGTLASAKSTAYRIEFFDNPAADNQNVTGHNVTQGRKFLGFISVTTDANGTAAISFTNSTPLTATDLITATATAPDGSTSEFSEFVAVT